MVARQAVLGCKPAPKSLHTLTTSAVILRRPELQHRRSMVSARSILAAAKVQLYRLDHWLQGRRAWGEWNTRLTRDVAAAAPRELGFRSHSAAYSPVGSMLGGCAERSRSQWACSCRCRRSPAAPSFAWASHVCWSCREKCGKTSGTSMFWQV